MAGFYKKTGGGVAQDEDLGRTQPDFVEQPRFQSHHRDLAASELEIGLGRALDLHELMQRTQLQRQTT